MSVQIYQSPSAVSFAGNPVLMKAITNLSNKTFLKVCVQLTAGLFKIGVTSQNAVFNLSIPTNGGGEATMFDFSSCMQSMFSQVERKPLDPTTSRQGSSGYVRYSFKVWDEYLDASNEVISTESNGSTSSGTFVAIPGAYTEIQRMLISENTAATLGNWKIITNKPDREMIPEYGMIVASLYSKSSKNVSVMFNGGSPVNMGVFSLLENEIAWSNLKTTNLSPGEYTVLFSDTGIRPIILSIIPPQPFATYFEFYNRLGGLESIYCYGRRKENISIQSERSIRYQGMSFRPNGRYSKRNVTQEQSIELSTGVISRDWAKWFVEEFFQAEHVWMKDDELGTMIPVIIEVDDDMNLYDDTEAQMIDLEFTVVKSINGYDTGSYLR